MLHVPCYGHDQLVITAVLNAALAAWDAYLAAEPNGQLVVEATYNRALCLVRLGRLADARTALLPFARGEVAPAGYRRAEAKALIERIDRRTNSLNGTRGCGDDPACE